MSNLSVSQVILTIIADKSAQWNQACSYISDVLTASNLAFADKNVMQRRISSASINTDLIDTFRTIIPEDSLSSVKTGLPILIKLWESLAQYQLAEEFKTLTLCDWADNSIGESKLSRVPGHSIYIANAELEYPISAQACDILADSFRLVKDPIFSVPLTFIPIGFPVKSIADSFFSYAPKEKTADYQQALLSFTTEVYVLCWETMDEGMQTQIDLVNRKLREAFTLLISLYDEEIHSQLSQTIGAEEE